jgi:hypothetical protein
MGAAQRGESPERGLLETADSTSAAELGAEPSGVQGDFVDDFGGPNFVDSGVEVPARPPTGIAATFREGNLRRSGRGRKRSAQPAWVWSPTDCAVAFTFTERAFRHSSW